MIPILQQLVDLLNDKNIHIQELRSYINQHHASKDKKLRDDSTIELWELFYQHAYPQLIQSSQGKFIILLWCIYLDENSLSAEILQTTNAQLLIESAQFKLNPLHVAAHKGNIPVSEQLLEAGFNINAAMTSGDTPLHLAAQQNNLELVQLLLHKGADLEAVLFNGRTPLHVAAKEGHLKLVQFLLSKNANVEAALSRGRTLLHRAVQKGLLELAQLLLSQGANVEAVVLNSGRTSLHLAAQQGHNELAQLLLSKGANAKAADNNDYTPLYLAAQKGNFELAQLLLRHGADAKAVTKEGYTPLYIAAQQTNLKLAQLLLSNGADAKAAANSGHTPLHLAAQKGHLQLTQLLLSYNADANAVTNEHYTPLHAAAHGDCLELVQHLLSKGADVKAVAANRYTPLHIAVQEGRLELAQLLLSNGADVKAVLHNGDTPLHQAAYWGRLELAQLLLSYGADVQAVANGSTPLHKAVYSGRLELVQLLFNNGAQIDPLPIAGQTALQVAVTQKHIDIINYLVLKGADVEITISEQFHRNTLLHWAIIHGHLNTVELLIKRGVDVNALGGMRNTPAIVYAIAHKHVEIIKLLLAHNATFSFSQLDSEISPELMTALEHNTTRTKIPGQTSKKYGEQLSKIVKRNKAIIKLTERILTEIRNITELHTLDIAARQHNLLFIEQEIAAIALLAPHASQLHQLKKLLITAYCLADDPQSAWHISQKIIYTEITQEQWQLIAMGLYTQLIQQPDNKACAHQVLTSLNCLESIDEPISSLMIQSMAHLLHKQGQELPAPDLNMSQLWQQHSQQVWQSMLNNYPQLIIHCIQQLIIELQNRPQQNAPLFSLTLHDENQHLQACFSACFKQLAEVIEQGRQHSKKRPANPQHQHQLDNLAPSPKRPCTQNNNQTFFARPHPKEQEPSVSGLRLPSN